MLISERVTYSDTDALPYPDSDSERHTDPDALFDAGPYSYHPDQSSSSDPDYYPLYVSEYEHAVIVAREHAHKRPQSV
jgi:hypothetical protein